MPQSHRPPSLIGCRQNQSKCSIPDRRKHVRHRLLLWPPVVCYMYKWHLRTMPRPDSPNIVWSSIWGNIFRWISLQWELNLELGNHFTGRELETYELGMPYIRKVQALVLTLLLLCLIKSGVPTGDQVCGRMLTDPRLGLLQLWVFYQQVSFLTKGMIAPNSSLKPKLTFRSCCFCEHHKKTKKTKTWMVIRYYKFIKYNKH